MTKERPSISIRVGDFILSPFPKDPNPYGVYEVIGCLSDHLKIVAIGPTPRDQPYWIPAKAHLYYRLTRPDEKESQ